MTPAGGYWTDALTTSLSYPISKLDLNADGELTWREFLNVVDAHVRSHTDKQHSHAFSIESHSAANRKTSLNTRGTGLGAIALCVPD
jgi:hypothetical protein